MDALAIDYRKVLILNKNWCAIEIAPLRKAITMLFKYHTEGKHKGEPIARIIDPTQDFQTFDWEDWAALEPNSTDVIHGIGADFRIPEVIMLTKYDKMPIQRTVFSRRMIHRRDNFQCQYCKCHVGNEGTIDHVKPKAQGGRTTWENCVLACVQCNSQKADRYPHEAVRGNKDVTWTETKSLKQRLPGQPAERLWKGPSPMVLLTEPKKPNHSLLKSDKGLIPKSWTHFMSEVYWQTELENDNEE